MLFWFNGNTHLNLFRKLILLKTSDDRVTNFLMSKHFFTPIKCKSWQNCQILKYHYLTIAATTQNSLQQQLHGLVIKHFKQNYKRTSFFPQYSFTIDEPRNANQRFGTHHIVYLNQFFQLSFKKSIIASKLGLCIINNLLVESLYCSLFSFLIIGSSEPVAVPKKIK